MLNRFNWGAQALSVSLVALFFGFQMPAGAAPQVVPTPALMQAQLQIPNMSVVASNFYRGGQPNYAALKELKAAGIQVDVSLDNERELVAQEQADCAAAGIRFVNIPLNPWKRPDDTAVNQFLELCATKDKQPMFVHCVHGRDRTGTMVAIYRLQHDGWAPDQAYQEMLDHGFRPFFKKLSDTVFDFGTTLGRIGHKPTLGFIAGHLGGHMSANPPIDQATSALEGQQGTPNASGNAGAADSANVAPQSASVQAESSLNQQQVLPN